MQLKPGDVAPLFNLLNQNLERVKLEDLRGKKVVLLFFPLANTSVCTKEMCSINDDYQQYKQLDAIVFGISVDSPQTLKAWAEKLNLEIILLSDFNKEVSSSYQALYEVFIPGKYDFKGVSKRAAFVIDRYGIIRYAEVLENAGNEPDYIKIKTVLSEIQ